MKKLKTEKGFTLIEVLVVISLIAILFLIFIPQVDSAILKSKESGIYTDFRSFQQASESYFRETRGVNLHIDSLNLYLEKENEISDNGSVKQTKKKDPWGNHYEVDLQTGKITFSSYGQKEDPSFKAYNLVTYLYNGVSASCTSGFGTRDLVLSIPNLDANFKCGEDLITVEPTNPTIILNPPTNFIANNSTAVSVVLSWGSVTGATNYELKRNGVVIYAGSNTSFSDTGLSSNTTYRYNLVAKNSNTSSRSLAMNVTIR